MLRLLASRELLLHIVVQLEELVHLELQLVDLTIESRISIEPLFLRAIEPLRVLLLAGQRLKCIVKLFTVVLELLF